MQPGERKSKLTNRVYLIWLIQEEMISEAITELQGSINQGIHL